MFARFFRALFSILLLVFLAASASAQLQLAAIRGTVVDDAGLGGRRDRRIDRSDWRRNRLRPLSDAAGRFTFPASLAVDTCCVCRCLASSLSIYPVTVDAALPVDITLRLTLRTAVDVIVGHQLEPDSPATRASIAGESIARIPVRTMASGVQEAVATLPGWATEDNGLLHVRGVDDGFLYVIDGVPVYERLDPLNGMGPPLANIESINVITGYIPAEFGHKAGGVIDVRSKSIGKDWLGTVQVERGSDDAIAASGLAAWRFSPALAMTLVANGQQSDRFLDPIHPDNFHNHGALGSAEGQLMWSASDSDVVTANVAFGAMDYDVPNNDLQETASQDQRQQIRRGFATLSWQHGFSSSTFSQLAAYTRRSKAALAGSEADTPLVCRSPTAAWSAAA